MGRYNETLAEAGVLLAGEGLKPSSHGKRVRLIDGDGPEPSYVRRPVRGDRRTWWAGVLESLWQLRVHGRGRRLGLALSHPDAGTERDRDPPGLRDGGNFRRPPLTPEAPGAGNPPARPHRRDRMTRADRPAARPAPASGSRVNSSVGRATPRRDVSGRPRTSRPRAGPQPAAKALGRQQRLVQRPTERRASGWPR